MHDPTRPQGTANQIWAAVAKTGAMCKSALEKARLRKKPREYLTGFSLFLFEKTCCTICRAVRRLSNFITLSSAEKRAFSEHIILFTRPPTKVNNTRVPQVDSGQPRDRISISVENCSNRPKVLRLKVSFQKAHLQAKSIF